MERRNRTLLRAAITATIALQLPSAVRADPPPGPNVEDAVILTAWLHVEDLTMADVEVHVEVNGVEQIGRVPENGRFEVSLPAGVDAVLRFEKPGHLPKEVVVDTHHVNDGGFDGKRRHVSFAVILELERHMAGYTYPTPVGSIGFEEGGGCLTVEHDRRKLLAERQTIMVF